MNKLIINKQNTDIGNLTPRTQNFFGTQKIIIKQDKIEKPECLRTEAKKKRSEENHARINEKKKAKEAKNYTQALGELKFAYNKKTD